MISPSLLLQKLEPYKNKKVVIVEEQSTKDIITGIIETSEKYNSEYDKILPFFEDDDLIETAKNVFDFLKKNCKYVIESTDFQTLRSPASIIATGKTKGCDCKSYSLFFMGILSAYMRKYKLKNKICFRFAGYDGKEIGHVFVVFKENNKEYWCDCVLDYFNDRSKTPTKFKDKNMALIQISGVPKIAGVQNWQNIGKSELVWNENCIGSIDSDIQTLLNAAGLSSFYDSVLALFDNSTGKWKSRLNAFRNLSPTQRLAWYMERARQKDQWDVVQYSEMFGKYAAHINDQPNIPINWAVAYNTILKQNYPNGASGRPLDFLLLDLSKVNPNPANLEGFDKAAFDKIKNANINASVEQVANLWERYKGGDKSVLPSDIEGGGMFNTTGTRQAGISTIALLGIIGAGVWFFLKGKKR
jgi:hypothetical protein